MYNGQFRYNRESPLVQRFLLLGTSFIKALNLTVIFVQSVSVENKFRKPFCRDNAFF